MRPFQIAGIVISVLVALPAQAVNDFRVAYDFGGNLTYGSNGSFSNSITYTVPGFDTSLGTLSESYLGVSFRPTANYQLINPTGQVLTGSFVNNNVGFTLAGPGGQLFSSGYVPLRLKSGDFSCVDSYWNHLCNVYQTPAYHANPGGQWGPDTNQSPSYQSANMFDDPLFSGVTPGNSFQITSTASFTAPSFQLSSGAGIPLSEITTMSGTSSSWGQTAVARITYSYTPFVGSLFNPILPSGALGGQFSFGAGDSVVSVGNINRPGGFFDPDVAVGYTYETNSLGGLFTGVQIPYTYGDGQFSLFSYDADLGDYVDSGAKLYTGQWYDFAGAGVNKFRIAGIELSAMVDPTNPEGFVTGLTFGAPDTQFTMAPLTAFYDPSSVSAVPLPAAAWLLGSGLLGLIGVARRKAV